MESSNNEALQGLVRSYLMRLSHMAKKHGLFMWLTDIIGQNKRGECKATRHEADLLARMVDEHRAFRSEIPQILGKTYRQCNDDGDFSRIGRMRNEGTFSKIDALMLKCCCKCKKRRVKNG